MPDRVIRDELLDSDRWLDLPTDTDRLAYVGLLLVCDDFGNLEGGIKRLYRFLHGFTQVKSEEVVATVLTHLGDADLIRRYEVDGREYWHIPRFRPHRQYLVQRYPQPPWTKEEDRRELGKTRRVILRGIAKDQPLAENVATTSLPRSNHVAEGVGVGVGVGEIQKRSSAAQPVDNFPPKSRSWADHWKARGKAFGIDPKPGESDGDYCRRVQAFAKAKA